MGTRKVKYNKSGIGKLPINKPVLYRIETEGGALNYAGIAQRGQSQKRISDHLDKIPGATVRIEQFNSIADAREKETSVIKRNQPKYNKQGK